MRRWWWIIPVVVLFVGTVGFVIWGSNPAGPMPEALAALASDDVVQVRTDPWLLFEPVQAQSMVGLVLYPGGRVAPRSYAPAARALAAEGYTVVIVPMPLNLAVLAPERATQVMAALPEIERWAIGGHSLGGAMAARFAYQHPDMVQGLALWAAYPAGNNDLSQQELEVVSIYGTRDGLAMLAEIEASRALLPPDTVWVEIPGGNHAQFGWYGDQSGDNPAALGREAQQVLVVGGTLGLLEELR